MACAAAKNMNNAKMKADNDLKIERTQHQQQSSVTPRTGDKTELEIIVNNPNYETKNVRPGSSRHKLLQDLRHTDISKMINTETVSERNRRNAEVSSCNFFLINLHF